MLRGRWIVYLLALHAALGLLALGLVSTPLEIVGVETAVVLSAVLGWRLLQSALVPRQLLELGGELIADGDFSSTFAADSGDPELVRLVAIYNRMIEALRAERLRAREQQTLLEKVLALTPIAILLEDFEGRLASISPSAAELLGAEAGVGQRLAELEHPLARSLAALEVGSSSVLEIGGRRVRALVGEFYDQGHRRRFVVLEELTAELDRSERRGVERVVRVMAHEVNNTIGSVIATLEATAEVLEEEGRPRLPHTLRTVAARGSALQRFVASSAELVKLPPLRPESVDLAALVADLATALADEAEAAGLVIDVIGLERLVVDADRHLIERALINILRNAMEASAAGSVVSIELRPEGLEIRDRGHGLGDEPIEVFKPFVSSKGSGRGIGLSLVAEILDRHGWAGRLENHPEGGCCFVLEFSRSAHPGSGTRSAAFA